MNEIDLGLATDYVEFPAKIELAHTPYWLVRTSEGKHRLLMAVCPHAGGEVRPLNDGFFCPLHFWSFHGEDGACQNIPGERLMQRQVELRDGRLYAVGGDL